MQVWRLGKPMPCDSSRLERSLKRVEKWESEGAGTTINQA